MQATIVGQTGLNLEHAETICIVPTLCVGTHLQTLCVASLWDAERPKGIPTQSVGTIHLEHPE